VRGWVVVGLDLGSDYVAALATAAYPCCSLQRLAWNEPAGCPRATPAIEAVSAAGASDRWSQF